MIEEIEKDSAKKSTTNDLLSLFKELREIEEKIFYSRLHCSVSDKKIESIYNQFQENHIR